MNKLLTAFLFAIGAMVSTTASAGLVVTVPGLSGFAINWAVQNTGPNAITHIDFDLTGTVSTEGTPLVFGGLVSQTNPAGGSAFLTGIGNSIFGFDFTGFDFGETFSFSWDPDTAANGAYGSTAIDGAGTLISYTDTTGASASGGVLVVDRANDRLINQYQVPEPGSLALLGIAAAVAMLARRRMQVCRAR